MKAVDYEMMMMRGWRRCGSYYYKPDLSRSCCLLHTIRLKAEEFKFDSTHRRTMKKFYNFINGEDQQKNIEEKKKVEPEESLSSSVQAELTARLRNAIKGMEEFKDGI